MKVILKINNLNTNEDVIKIREAIANNEGVIACEVNMGKKEVNVVYDDKITEVENITACIEEIGYTIE